MSALSDNSIDFCISIYSPISFVERPELMIQEIGRVLKKNATALIMGHSFHNALDSKINNFLSGSQELDKLYENHKVQWNDSLPLLHTFSIEDFQKLGNKHNLFCDQGYGITIYAKPTNEDWDSSNVKI